MTTHRIVASKYLAGVLLFLVTASIAQAQLSTYLQTVRPQSAVEGEPLVVSVSLSQTSALSRVMLFYRQLGTSDYRSMEMQISRDSASAIILQAEIAPPFLEYYLVAETQTGIRETYPLSSPQTTPSRITILPRSTKDSEVLILNPEVNEPIQADEMYITLSFVYAGAAVDMRRTKIFLNSFDCSSSALTVGDLLIVGPDMIPDNLKGGTVALRVELYDTTGTPYHTIRRTVTMTQGAGIADAGPELYLNGTGQTESRSENIRGAAKTYNRFDVRANASYGILKSTANIQLSSEENPGNQPQNRYFIGFDAKYLKLGFGDTYQQYPSTLMDGLRVRGVSAEASYGAVRITATEGEIVRGIVQDSITRANRRTLTAVRPSFGKGENFQWGISFLHSKDEWNPGTTLKPQENVVGGTDLLVAIDDRRIEWTSQASVSLSNLDISSPAFTVDSITAAVERGSLNRSDGDNLKSILPYAKKLITFNENISPLNPAGKSSLAFETALSLNYFNNYLRGTYTYHGNDYTSFGATSFRRDVQGYNISDRIRLMGNSLFITGSLEQLTNNVAQFEQSTTTWTNTTGSVSWFAGGKLPDLTVGVSINNISNDNLPTDSLSSVYSPQIDYATKRFFVQSSYAFAWIGSHTMMLSIDYSNADDKSVRNQDVTGFNGMLYVTTIHSASLESTFGLMTSLNTLPSASNGPESMNYTTVTLGVGYKFLHERMKATATLAPTIGAIKRTQTEAGLQYALFAQHIVSAQYRYTVNSSIEPTVLMPGVNESAFTISYRMYF